MFYNNTSYLKALVLRCTNNFYFMFQVHEMRLHHLYVNGGGDGIGKNHLDKCQQGRLMYQLLKAMFLSKLKLLCVYITSYQKGQQIYDGLRFVVAKLMS